MVPAKSLARLRSTSKQWNDLLKSGSFAKIHSANAPKESMIIMLMDYEVYLARFNLHGIDNSIAPSVKVASQLYLKDRHICDVFHCDGLLMLCIIKENRLEVWNPCSGETKLIKPRNSFYYKESDLYAFGYDNRSSCKKYKVLRMDRHGHVLGIHNKESEIYDFTNDSWRVLGATIDWFILPNHSGVSVKGSTYWVALTGSGPYHQFILSFDFSTERFQRLSLPHSFFDEVAALSVVREEQLCFLGCYDNDTYSEHLHVWVTTSIGSVMSWSKILTVQNIYQTWDLFAIGTLGFLADEQNKVLVCCNKWTTNKIIHIVGEIIHIQHVDDHGRDSTSSSSCSALLYYVPSLTQIQ